MSRNNSYTIPDFYKYYIDSIDNELYHIDYSKYRDIVEDYFKGVSDLLFDGYAFKIPCRMGELSIIKAKPKSFTKDSLSINFKATRELGKIIYHLNDHSAGFKYRFFWCKRKALFTNKTKYQLIMTRANKRKLASVIKNKEHDYIEI